MVASGIEVSLTPHHYGFFEEEISIYNTHSRDEALLVKVRLFVQERLLRLFVEDGDASAATPNAEGISLDFGCTYLRPHHCAIQPTDAETQTSDNISEDNKKPDNGVNKADEDSNERGNDEPELELNASEQWKTVVLENITQSDLLLRVRTEFDMDMAWSQYSDEPQPSTICPNTQASHFLKAEQKARLLIAVPRPTSKTLLQAVSQSNTVDTRKLLYSLGEGQRVDVLGTLQCVFNLI